MSKYDAALNIEEDNSLSLILRNIMPHSIVLEFGPATGRMTKYLKEKLECKVTIIELDQECYNSALKFADQGFLCDIDSLSWEQYLKPDMYDAIIFADVLEHLRKPSEVISACYKYLNHNGQIYVSVPNIAHNSIITNLFKDTFRYNNIGLLDNTHIHFFTPISICEMLSGAGYTIEKTFPVFLGAMAKEFPFEFSDLSDVEKAAIYEHKSGLVYQTVVIGSKQTNKKEHILFDGMEFPNIYHESFNLFLNCEKQDKSNSKIIELPYKKGINEICLDLKNYGYIETLRLDWKNLFKCLIRIDKVILDGQEIAPDRFISNCTSSIKNYFYFESLNPVLVLMNVQKKVENIHVLYYMEDILVKTIIPDLMKTLALPLNQSNNQNELLPCPKPSMFKRIYKNIPISDYMKKQMKHFIFDQLGLFHHKNAYIQWKIYRSLNQLNEKYPLIPGFREREAEKRTRKVICADTVEIMQSFTARIAVQVHIYYGDLWDEFYSCLQEIPYRYDLFVSVVDNNLKPLIERKIKNVTNIGTGVVEVIENRGRDVAPLLAVFNKALKTYDYICHIHTKKSLYTGAEKQCWRRYLLENIAGNWVHVGRILTLMESNPDIGIFFPEPYREMPYWAYHWLSNEGIGLSVLQQCGFNTISINYYFDMPCGTMFWAKTKAIMPLLDLNLSIDDFPAECGQTDGTIAHAMERCFGIVPRQLGYEILTSDIEKQVFYIGPTEKNFSQYYSKDKAYFEHLVDSAKIVTFDVFDSLIMRVYLKPEYVFEAVGLWIKDNYDVRFDFVGERKKAEFEWRKEHNFGKDCSIDDIYEQMKKNIDVDGSILQHIKEQEIKLEMQCCIPRRSVIHFLAHCASRGKRIMLVSDMYLPSNVVKKILDQCGVPEVYELCISCETQKRKDTGAFWDWLLTEYRPENILHLGDNAHSDIQLTGDRGIPTIHVFSALDMVQNVPYFSGLDRYVKGESDGLLLGLVAAKNFEDPWILNQTSGNFNINDPFLLGYSALGPIISNYILWLGRRVIRHQSKTVLFISREGYLLKPLFDMLKNVTDELADVQSVYLLGSRRALTVPGIITLKDAENLLEANYSGSVYNLFHERYGTEIDEEYKNQMVVLPEDVEAVKKVLNQYWDLVSDNSHRERKSYLAYLDGLKLKLSEPIELSDIGYAGTSQYYLSIFLQKGLFGSYLGINEKMLPEKISGNEMEGLYCQGENLGQTKSLMYKYHMALESIMTSPHGQFKCFRAEKNGEITPVYKQDKRKEKQIQTILEIQDGIKCFMKDVLKYSTRPINLHPSNILVENIYARMFTKRHYISDEILRNLEVDDEYCSDNYINILQLY